MYANKSNSRSFPFPSQKGETIDLKDRRKIFLRRDASDIEFRAMQYAFSRYFSNIEFVPRRKSIKQVHFAHTCMFTSFIVYYFQCYSQRDVILLLFCYYLSLVYIHAPRITLITAAQSLTALSTLVKLQNLAKLTSK